MRTERLVLSDPREPDGTGGVARFHALWFCALTAAGALITLIRNDLSVSALVALSAMACAGAAGFLFPRGGRAVLTVWALAAAVALTFGGGLISPATPWLLTVVPAALLLRRPLREGLVLTAVALVAYAGATLGGWSPARPTDAENLLLLLSSFGTAAWALIAGLRAKRFDESPWAQRFSAIASPRPATRPAVTSTAPAAPEQAAAESARKQLDTARQHAEAAEAELAQAEAARAEAKAAAEAAEAELAEANATRAQAELARAHAETVKEELAAAESAQAEAEAARRDAESEAAAAESARIEAEAEWARAQAALASTQASQAGAQAAQAVAETQRAAAQAAQAEADAARRQAEAAAAELADAASARSDAEAALAEAQAALLAAERARREAEALRAEADAAHRDLSAAEGARVQAEFSRLQAHAELAEAEMARAEAEDAWTRRRAELAAAEAARAEAEEARVQAEAELAAAESARTEADTARVKAETGRAMAEAARVEAQAARAQADAAKLELADAEAARKQAEAAWAEAEHALADAERARAELEVARTHAEAARENLARAEAARSEAAEARAAAEAELAQAEIHRAEAEAAWAQAEADIAAAEAARTDSEAARRKAEAETAAATAARAEAEAARVQAEAERAAADAARAEAEVARAQANAAEAGLANAEAAKADAEAAWQQAERERAAAEHARSQAEAARAGAEEARREQAAAEASRHEAEAILQQAQAELAAAQAARAEALSAAVETADASAALVAPAPPAQPTHASAPAPDMRAAAAAALASSQAAAAPKPKGLLSRLLGLVRPRPKPVAFTLGAPVSAGSGLPSPAAPSADSPQSLAGRAIAAVRRHMLWVVLFSACVNLLYLAPSIYMMQVYDRVLATGGMGTLVFVSLVLVLSLAVLGLLDMIRTRILTRTSLRLDRLMSRTILEGAFASNGDARSAQAMRDFDTVRQTATGPAALAVLDAPWAPIYIGVCFLIHPSLGLLVVFGGVVLVLVALLNERSQRKALKESSEKSAALMASHEAERQGAEAARALGFRGALIDRHLSARADMLDAQSTAAFSNAGYASVTKFVRILLQSAALGLGAYLAIQREVSPGAIIAATILTSRAFAPLEQIVGAWRQIAGADAAWKAVKTLLSGLPDKHERTPLPAPRGEVSLEDIAVKAPNAERLLIGEISARLQPGEIVGVMGPSGAGKSTLARAIAGAVSPFYGVIRMDGASYADWEPEELARHIGYLPQDVQLFAGTVAENIARFQTGQDAANNAVLAAQKAGAHEMILRLPDGYNTRLGPLGRGLSFGQAQRIGLARALYGDPALLVLDEPNAHLDADGEAALINALKDAKARGATCVVVAHRPGTMSVADKVMVVRDGRLEAFGPREQVVSKLSAVPASPAPAGGPVNFAGAPL